jgi:hypothetical protein
MRINATVIIRSSCSNQVKFRRNVKQQATLSLGRFTVKALDTINPCILTSHYSF